MTLGPYIKMTSTCETLVEKTDLVSRVKRRLGLPVLRVPMLVEASCEVRSDGVPRFSVKVEDKTLKVSLTADRGRITQMYNPVAKARRSWRART